MAGNPAWVNKWGVYRQNGGVNTPNVVAPQLVDGGGNNVQMEIRSTIGGFCLFSACSTFSRDRSPRRIIRWLMGWRRLG